MEQYINILFKWTNRNGYQNEINNLGFHYLNIIIHTPYLDPWRFHIYIDSSNQTLKIRALTPHKPLRTVSILIMCFLTIPLETQFLFTIFSMTCWSGKVRFEVEKYLWITTCHFNNYGKSCTINYSFLNILWVHRNFFLSSYLFVCLFSVGWQLCSLLYYYITMFLIASSLT